MAVERPTTVRPFWSGVVTFGLVAIPVDLFAAVVSSGPSLRLVGPEGRPLARRYVDPEQREPLSSEDIVRGVEVEPGRFVTVTDDELERIEPEKTREIDLRRFVQRDAIDPIFCDRPWFLLPQGEVTKAYRLLARTMEETGRAGVASFVMRGREHLIAILADRGILRAETLRHPDEVRTPEEVGLPAFVEPPKDRVTAWQREIERLAADALDLEELSDERARALQRIGEKKPRSARVHLTEEVPAEPSEVVDLMEILRQRLAGSEEAPRTQERPASPERTNRPPDPDRTNRPPEPEDLSRLSKKELYARAQELDLPGRSKMSREALIEALSGASPRR